MPIRQYQIKNAILKNYFKLNMFDILKKRLRNAKPSIIIMYFKVILRKLYFFMFQLIILRLFELINEFFFSYLNLK